MNNTFHNQNCMICQQLLDNLTRFFEMLEQYKNKPTATWLTVEQVAKELQVSKSIIYQIIRNGELEAVDITNSKNDYHQKGHYRIKRKSLNEYLERKKVNTPIKKTNKTRASRTFPKTKNYLGL